MRDPGNEVVCWGAKNTPTKCIMGDVEMANRSRCLSCVKSFFVDGTKRALDLIQSNQLLFSS